VHEKLASTYDAFGRQWAHGTSPLYEEWAIGIGGDPEILALIAALPRLQQQPNRIFAAARWAGSPLAPFPAWREWLVDHWAEVEAIAAVRTVQTNEVSRCATWIPPMSAIDGPLALLEVGAAAGLCLFPDRYSYEYESNGIVTRLDPADGASDVVLPCRIDDPASIPERLPDVVWRRGIDLNPIDAGDGDTVDWLATLVWPGPDHDGRVDRLRRAAALVAAERPQIVTGDLLERLEDVAATAPAEATLVVYHSAVLLYLDPSQRRRFADLIGSLGARISRRVVWLSNETVGTLPEIDAQVPPGIASDHRFVQTIDGTPIAMANQHGAFYETRQFRASRSRPKT